MNLNLLVIKTHKLLELAEFYSLLGLEFEYHKHEQGPFHYSTKLGETVFEIYPLSKKIVEADSTTRLGFNVNNLDSLIANLKLNNAKILFEPDKNMSEYTAIVEDLDGRKIELVEIQNGQ